MKTAPRVARIFMMIAAAVIGSVIVTYWNGLTVLHSRDKIVAESQVIRNLDGLLSSIKDAETGQRGYLLTGEEKYLEPYNEGIQFLSPQLSSLEAAHISEGTEPLVSLIEPMIQEKLAELHRSIEARRNGYVDTALTMVKTDEGKALMDRIRSVVARIQAQQEVQYGEAVRLSTRATHIRTIVFTLCGLINLLFLSWAYRLIASEIRERRATQSEAEREREEAIRQKETLRVTLASIGDCVIVTDLKGLVTFMNATAEALTGWTLTEARSLPVAQVFKIINEFTQSPVASPVDMVLKGGINGTMARHTMLIRKDGSQVPIDDSSAPIRNAKAEILGVVLVFRDFSGYKKAEKEFNGAKETAEAASRTKDHFLAMLSHELRTPLMPVLATLNAWELTSELPASLEADVELIRRNVEMECRLIDDLLDLTRISKGKLSLQPEVTNVHHLIKLAVGMCEEQVRANHLEIRQELRAVRPYVNADPARLQQVVWNIVKNAAKFTGQGGRISVVTDNDPKGNIRIVFTDSGLGMSRETLSRLFRPFEQGERDEARRSGGLGLGMSISRAILELMGGSISAASKGVGEGSSFTVTVPSVEAPKENTPKPAGAALKTNYGRKLKILLVEDHVDTAITMKRLLELRGHELHLAHSVAEAVKTIDNQKFELLLCDLGLPDGTGFDVIRHYRELYQTPAIAVSGFGMESDIASCLEAGFDAHLTKPINFQQMEIIIRKLTETRPCQLQVSR